MVPSSLLETIEFGDNPRYERIRGGGDTTWLEHGHMASSSMGIDKTRADVYKWAQRIKRDLQSSKQIFSNSWDYFYQIFTGRQWVSLGRNGEVTGVELPKWRAKLVVNMIQPVVDLEVATIFDNEPRPYLSVTSPDQNWYISGMQAAVDQIWDSENILDKMKMAAIDAFGIYGTAVLKTFWDSEADNGVGAIRVINVPIDNFYVDRDAFSLHHGEYTTCMEISQMAYSKVCKMFPESAKYIRMDSSSQPYQEQKETNGFGGSWDSDARRGIISPGDSAGLRGENSSSFNNAVGAEDYMLEVIEIWTEDTSTKMVTTQKEIGRTPWGAPVMTTVTEPVKAYPNGRLITVAGGIVVQDTPSPYSRPPYVLLRGLTLSRRFWGIGLTEMAADSQRELNHSRSHLMDARNRMGNPTWLIPEDSIIEPDMDLSKPGVVVSWKGNAHPPQRLEPPNMPNWILEMMHLPAQDIYVTAGVSNAVSSPASQGKRSGTAVQAADSSATVRIRSRADQVRVCVKDLTRNIIDLIQRFWVTSKWLMVTGSWGQPTPVPFDYRCARGQWDIKVECASSSASSELARRQEAMMLFDKHVIAPHHLLHALKWPGREQIIQDMKFYAEQIPQYPGWPGMAEQSPAYSNSQSGYAMASRFTQQPPPPPPPQMMQGGGPHQGPPKPKGGSHRPTNNMNPMSAFGKFPK